MQSKNGVENTVYLDESGFDGEESFRKRGWAKRGEKVYDKITGKRFSRTSLLLAQRNYKTLAPFIFKGTCNTELFNEWLEKILIPELPEKQIIIMDNASIHKNRKTREIIEEAGHILLYLPPYSPDLNPIENRFAIIKQALKTKNANLFNYLSTA